MKILLINPPQTFYPKSNKAEGSLPLGLMYIAAVLENEGYEVEILDAFLPGVATLKANNVIEVGMSFESIKEDIQRRKPEVIGIANPFSTQIENAKRVADVAKEIDPSIWTVVGGPHVSVVPQKFLENTKTVDVVVIGEGEYTMLSLAKAFEGKKSLSDVDGIAYRQNDVLKQNQPRAFIKNLDELPFPAYHLVGMKRYLNPVFVGYRSFKPNSLPMITSRGCPYDCNFCSVHLHMGKSFRFHSPEYVINHIEYVVRNYGVEYIFFEDDNLTFDMGRMNAICDKIIEAGIKFGWETPNGVRADRVNLELLEKMKRVGCQNVVFGVESGNQWVSDNIVGKALDLGKVVEAAKSCKKIGLKCGMFYIIGFPGEKKDQMIQTVNFALRLKKDYDVGMRLFVATPLFGTRLYEECVENGYLKEELTPQTLAEVRQANGKPLIETNDFTAEDVKEISSSALGKYKKLALLNGIKHPLKLFKSWEALQRRR